MSYPNDIKDKFVELRADGQSFGDISKELGVPKPTLHRWADQHADDILRLRRTEWEDLETSGHWRAEDLLLDLNSDLDRLEEHVRRFPVQHLSLRDTIMLMREKCRERDRLRTLLMGTRPRRGRDGAPSPSGSALPAAPVATPAAQENISVDQRKSEPEDSNKTERFAENGTTQPRNTNDLQRSESESFHFPHQSKIQNPESKLEAPKLAELDPDDPNFFDGSIVIGNDEPARSILESQGLKLSKSKEHASGLNSIERLSVCDQ